MSKHSHPDQVETRNDNEAAVETLSAHGTLPNRLMTAFEVAEFIGCHEESVRRAYRFAFALQHERPVSRSSLCSTDCRRVGARRRDFAAMRHCQ